MAFRIVPIAEEHIAGFRAAVDSVAREKRYLAIVKGFSIEETREFVHAGIRRGVPQFVAVADGGVIGWCDVLSTPRHALAHIGTLGMGVLDGCRGKGIGTALLRATLEKARANGLTRVELTVREDNLRARALYEKFGFVAEGLKRNGFLIEGAYFNLVLMGLLFERSNAS